MDYSKQFSLGTVQFGLNYGISNSEGQTSKEVVFQILDFAKSHGIQQIDTAQAYGNSEKVLSEYPDLSPFHITSKTLPFKAEQDYDWQAEVRNKTEDSIQYFSKAKSLCFLTHGEKDLEYAKGNWLYDFLKSLQNQSLIEEFGVSLYDPNKIIPLKKRYPKITRFQVPFNLLDQRILNPEIQKFIKDEGLKIEYRSIFLQGLLLMDQLPSRLEFMKEEFAELQDWFKQTNGKKNHLCLSWAFQQEQKEKVILGVNNLDQLVDNYKRIQEIQPISKGPKPCKELRVIRPDQW